MEAPGAMIRQTVRHLGHGMEIWGNGLCGLARGSKYVITRSIKIVIRLDDL